MRVIRFSENFELTQYYNINVENKKMITERLRFCKLSVMTADKAAAAFSGLPERVLPLFKPPAFFRRKA